MNIHAANFVPSFAAPVASNPAPSTTASVSKERIPSDVVTTTAATSINPTAAPWCPPSNVSAAVSASAAVWRPSSDERERELANHESVLLDHSSGDDGGEWGDGRWDSRVTLNESYIDESQYGQTTQMQMQMQHGQENEYGVENLQQNEELDQIDPSCPYLWEEDPLRSNIPGCVRGAPITALAYDRTDDVDLLYVGGAQYPAGSSNQSKRSKVTDRMNSMHLDSPARPDEVMPMSSHAFTSLSDFNIISPYMSVAGHPHVPAGIEGRLSYLGLHQSSLNLHRLRLCQPRPPFGFGNVNPNRGRVDLNTPPTLGCGIRTILPFRPAFIVSASPSGILAHSRGGMALCRNTDVSASCVAPNPTDGPGLAQATHITCGTLGSSGSSSKGADVLTCLDVYGGLRAVTSLAVGGGGTSCLSAVRERGALAVGCADGTLRLADGSLSSRRGVGRRAAESVMAFSGGIVGLDVYGDYLAATGLVSGGACRPAVPRSTDARVLLFDVRAMRKGPVSTHFFGPSPESSGTICCPWHLAFVPPKEDEGPSLLVVGDTGLMEVLRFQDGMEMESCGLFRPALETGEAVTSLALSPDSNSLSIGTDGSRIMTYIRHKNMQVQRRNPSWQEGGGEEMNPTAPSFVPGATVESHNANTNDHDTAASDFASLLPLPPLLPNPPPLSISSDILLETNCHRHLSKSTPSRSSLGPTSPFSHYIMLRPPFVSNSGPETYGYHYKTSPWDSTLLSSISHHILSSVLEKHISCNKQSLAPNPPAIGGGRHSHRRVSKTQTSEDWIVRGVAVSALQNASNLPTAPPTNNPNKYLYGGKRRELCYEIDVDPRMESNTVGGQNINKRGRRFGGTGEYERGETSGLQYQHRSGNSRDETGNRGQDDASCPPSCPIPHRYRHTIQPAGSITKSLDYGKHNNTGLWPGWDASYLPNGYVCPVLLLLFFIPEVREGIHTSLEKMDSGELNGNNEDGALATELGFLFHQIECLSIFSRIHSTPNVGAFIPSNFVATFATLPEAAALALLDSSPTAVKLPRRLEAFYRFMIHHFQKPAGSGTTVNKLFQMTGTWKYGQKSRKGGNNNHTKFEKEKIDSAATLGSSNITTPSPTYLLDSLQGFDFVSINTFVAGPRTSRTTRAFTVELSYDKFVKTMQQAGTAADSGSSHHIPFRSILRESLCRESRLRAWNAESKSYETTVQKRIMTSLPKILSISCACAGNDDDSTKLWRQNNEAGGHWLPEFVEVELYSGDCKSGAETATKTPEIKTVSTVVVSELIDSLENDKKEWKSCGRRLPDATAKNVMRYRLSCVVSFVRSKPDDETSPSDKEYGGHHVLHARVPHSYTQEMLTKQAFESESCAETNENLQDGGHLTLTSTLPPKILRDRAAVAREVLRQRNESAEDEWVLFNGFNVSRTIVDDARAFHIPFKDPCIVLYRSCGEEEGVDKNLQTGSKKEWSPSNMPQKTYFAKKKEHTTKCYGQSFNCSRFSTIFMSKNISRR
mmetsp:Transcript_15045/g.33555  ORF Transcript_15045/g.33555 Transcript_15045/m.33555 type:complete len:1493 (-) Transcript_15045:59-4537(-)